MAHLSVVVQERRQLMRDGVALVLDGASDLRVAGVATTGSELVELVEAEPCDVVILELDVQEWDVAEVIARVRELRPAARIAGLHAGRRSDQVAHAKRLGVDALLSYGLGAHAIRSAVRGDAAPTSAPTVDRRVAPGGLSLSERELAVLAHIAAGLTTEESAAHLGITAKTVENYKHRLFSKLGVQNQAHAVATAHRLGILRPRAAS